jgi:hypothetical protein
MVRMATKLMCMRFVLTGALDLGIVWSLTSREALSQVSSYPLSYSGRLTLPSGEPMTGPA